MASIFKRNGRGNWIIQYYDENGRRREKTSRTTDKRAAERIANRLEADVALRRSGVVDARQHRFAEENRKPLDEHVEEYLASCRGAGQAKSNVREKKRHLERLLSETGAARFSDLTPDVLQRNMQRMMASGLSARSANFRRQAALAFMNWCVKFGRIESNSLKVVAKLDEQRDRRRVRRALTETELAQLLDVAGKRGRKAWYMAAALAGLRRGDLERLTWSDVDFKQGTITIRNGKSKRDDIVPLHPQLADELQRIRPKGLDTTVLPRARVFPTSVTTRTQQRDFLRAGLAREEVVSDENGEPVLIGKGKRRRPKTRIVTEDDDGRVIDLHALRTTLGTQLARQGVAPQIAQRIMRHSDYKTTLGHYTILDLKDVAGAISLLPRIGSSADEPVEDTSEPPAGSQQIPQQLVHASVPRDATSCGAEQAQNRGTPDANSLSDEAVSDGVRWDAEKRVTGLEPATFSLGS